MNGKVKQAHLLGRVMLCLEQLPSNNHYYAVVCTHLLKSSNSLLQGLVVSRQRADCLDVSISGNYAGEKAYSGRMRDEQTSHQEHAAATL
jgi:hypothetical protein